MTRSDLYAALERRCQRVWKRRSTVLFRRGEKAFGMFLVRTGSVTLDFGVDGAAPLGGTHGPGALVGLPATIIQGDHSMTATVTADSELGFVTTDRLIDLLREQPELCQQLLAILSVKVAHSQQVTKALLSHQPPPTRLDAGVA